MTRDQVLWVLRGNRDELRRRFAVKSLALFGSVAQDQAADTSDVDLLVEFDRRISLFHLVETAQHLEKLLGVAEDKMISSSVTPSFPNYVTSFMEKPSMSSTPRRWK